MADTGRDEDALKVYPSAIKAQRECWRRLPEASAIRDSLSKMYYNYEQSLRRRGQFSAAVEAASSRKEIWQGNGERLFGVAAELAEIAGVWRARDAKDDRDGLQKLDQEIIGTLQTARESGWHDEAKLASDERFAFLRADEQYKQLMADAASRAASAEIESGGAEKSDDRPKD